MKLGIMVVVCNGSVRKDDTIRVEIDDTVAGEEETSLLVV